MDTSSAGDLLRPEAIVLFVLLVAPGYVAVESYDLLVPVERRNWGEEIIRVVSISLLFVALWTPLVAVLAGPVLALPVGWRLLVLYAFVLVAVFVLPFLLARIYHALRISLASQTAVVQPVPTAFDFVFGRAVATQIGTDEEESDETEGFWVRARYTEGGIVAGYFAGDSYASPFPRPQQLYLEERWDVDEEGHLLRRSPDNQGVIIYGERCEWIGVLPALPTPSEEEQGA
jgi:hypothetical protein